MKVSIIIPVYNVDSYIETCLQSVFNQTYQNIEVIIVDDCGTDHSMEIVEKVVSTYKGTFSIKILHHNLNSGLSAARNTGIKNATGEYIYFLDSDDTLPNNSIFSLVTIAQEYPNVDFVIGEMEIKGSNQTYPLLTQKYINNNTIIFTDYLQYKWYIMACNKLLRRKFILEKQLLFKEGLLHEDEDFSFRLAQSANSMACCYAKTYTYRINNSSITSNKTIKNFKDQYRIIYNNFQSLAAYYTPNINKRIVSDYLINSIFSSIKTIQKEKSISPTEKKEFIHQIRNLKNIFNNFNKPSFKALIKLQLIKLPYVLQKLLLTNI